MDTNSVEVSLIKDINPGFSQNHIYPIDSAPGDVVADNADKNSFSSIPRPSRPLNSTPNNSSPDGLFEFKDKLYFSADDGENGRELFVSDGTADGTQLVTDLRPGESKYDYSYSSSPYNFTEFNDKLYFTANDGIHGNELFVSDGTAGGTQLVADLRPGQDSYSPNGSYVGNFTEFNDKLYFTANDGKVGNELFVSDGTAGGTQLVTDLRPGQDNDGNINGSYPSNLVQLKGKLYFTANDGKVGNELFVSDGTAGGTQLVVDLSPGKDNFGNINGSDPRELMEFNNKLYFTATNSETGNELYVSDGTAEGTKLLMDINPGTNKYDNVNNSDPSNFLEFNGKFYFSANDGVHGGELFVSDGTADGTKLLTDINQGQDSSGNNYGSYPSNLVEFNGQLYFTANNGENGNELYVSDGTTEGTKLLADIKPGLNNYGFPNGSYASTLEVIGDELFFSADDGQVGNELFKLTANDSSNSTFAPMTITDSAGDDLFILQTGEGSDTICGLAEAAIALA